MPDRITLARAKEIAEAFDLGDTVFPLLEADIEPWIMHVRNAARHVPISHARATAATTAHALL